MLPTYHVSGAVLGPGGQTRDWGQAPHLQPCSWSDGSVRGRRAGLRVLKADHPRRKQDDELDKSTEVPTSLVCPRGVSPLDTAGQGGGDSAGGQKWGVVVRGVCRMPDPSRSGWGGRSLRGGKRKSNGSASSNALSVGLHHLRGGEGGRGPNNRRGRV